MRCGKRYDAGRKRAARLQRPQSRAGENQELAGRFRAENGSIICRELLGLARPEGTPQAEARTPEYYKKRPCPELVALAAQILEEWLAEHPARL